MGLEWDVGDNGMPMNAVACFFLAYYGYYGYIITIFWGYKIWWDTLGSLQLMVDLAPNQKAILLVLFHSIYWNM